MKPIYYILYIALFFITPQYAWAGKGAAALKLATTAAEKSKKYAKRVKEVAVQEVTVQAGKAAIMKAVKSIPACNGVSPSGTAQSTTQSC